MATFPTLNAQTSELLQSGRAKDAQSTQAANDLLASWPQEAQDLYWAARNSKTVIESAADDGAMMHTAEQLKRIVAKAYGRPELAALPLRAFNEGNQDFNTGREALQRMTDLAKRSARPDINDPKIQAAALIGDESKAIYEFLQNLRANDGERIEAAKAARLAELQNTTWSIDGEEKERLIAGDLETTAKIEQGRLDREHFIEAAKQFGLYPEDVEGDETYDRIQTEIRTLQRDLAPAINQPIPVPDLPERKPTMSLREAWGKPPMDVGERWEGGQAQENIGTWKIQSANAVRDSRIEELDAHATLIKDNLAYDNLVMRLSQNAAMSSYLEVYDTLNPAERELIKRAFVAGQEGINLGHMVAEGGFSEDNAKRTFGATAPLDELNAWEADNGRWTRVGNQYLFARIDPAHEETVRTIISLARGRIEEPQYLADLFNRVGQSFDRTFGNIPRFIAASAKQLGHSFFSNEDSYANYAEQTRYEARREALWEAATSALTYDPGYGWFGDAVIGMAEQTPIWLTLAAGGAASAISGGAVPGTQIAMGTLAMGYAEDTRQKLILDGADPLSALVGGVASGVVQSWIERAQAEALIGKNAVGKFMLSGAHDAKVAIANAFYKRSLREFGTWQFAQTAFRLGGGIAANGFLEAVEEGLQAGADRLISDIALGDPNFERALKTGIKEFKDTFATMMVTAGFGGTVRVTRDFAQAASVGKRLRILTGQGKVGERAMKAIEEVGKTMDVAALREAWRNASNDRARIKLLMDTGHLPKSQASALHAYLIAEEKIADRHDALAMQMMLDMSNEGAKTFANNPEAIKRVMQAIGLRNVKVEATVIGTVTKDNAKNEREGWAVSATLPGGGTVTFTVGVMTEQEKTLDGGAATASSAWEALQDAKELKGMTQSQFAERWRTDEAWRAKLIKDYSLARRGETLKFSESPYLVATFTTPDGKTRKRKVSAAGAILLATGGHGRQVVAENKTLAHETLHALVQLLRDTGVLTADAPIVQDLRRIYGDPAKGVDELFNEERFADDLAATAGRGIEAIERAAGEATRRKVGPVASALHGIADLFLGGGDFVLDNGTITVRKEADANARANRFVDAINLHVLLGASKQAADVFRETEKQRSIARLQRLREGIHARIKEAREKAETEAEQALRDAEIQALVDSDLSEMAQEAHAVTEAELNAVRTEIEEAAANIREHYKGFDPKAEGESAKRTSAEGKKLVDRWRALKNRELELMRTLADLNVDPGARRTYFEARENEAYRLQGRAARQMLDETKRRINETPVADGDALLANTRAIGHVTVESRESYIKRKMNENGWDRKTAIAQATHLYPEDMADLRAPWANRNLYTGEGGHSPDTAAQALYDDGRIADPTVDAFWDAVRGDIEVVSKAKKREIEAAEAEAVSALEWGKERHLQTLAAIEMQDEATGLGMGQERSSIGGDTPPQKTPLVAMHFISASHLASALKHGGLPTPSIAVAREDADWNLPNGYGDCLLFFKKETVDPKADPRNVVFPGDAMTPRYPKNTIKKGSLDAALGELKRMGWPNPTEAALRKEANFLVMDPVRNIVDEIETPMLFALWVRSVTGETLADPESVRAYAERLRDPETGSIDLTLTAKDKWDYTWEERFIDGVGRFVAFTSRAPASAKAAQEAFDAVPVKPLAWPNGSWKSSLDLDYPALISFEDIEAARTAMTSATEGTPPDAKRKALDRLADAIAKPGVPHATSIRRLANDLAYRTALDDALALFQTENKWYATTPEARDAFLDFVRLTRNIKENYYEAKPRRIVGLDEIALAVIPQDQVRLKWELEKRGIPYETYPASDTYAIDQNHEIAQRAVAHARFSIGGLYSGGPSAYSRPSLRAIGTNDAGRAYGWGLYATTERDMAEGYAGATWRELANAFRFGGKTYAELTQNDTEAAKLIEGYTATAIAEKRARGYDPEALKRDLQRDHAWIEDYLAEPENDPANMATYPQSKQDRLRRFQTRLQNVERLLQADITMTERGTPSVHEQLWWTNRPAGDESHLLTWDARISEENRKRVINAVRSLGLTDEQLAEHFGAKWDSTPMTGEQAYGFVTEAIRDLAKLDGDAEALASQLLARHDVDGTVRHFPSGGSIYVAFSDEHLQVVRRWIWDEGTEEFVLDRSFTPPPPTEAEARVTIGDDQAIAEAQANRSSIIGWKGALSLDVGGWRLKEDERKVRRLVKDATDGRRLLDGYYDAKREVERLVGTDFTRGERVRASRLTREGPIARDAIILAERWRRYTQSDEATEVSESIAYRNWGWTLGKDGQWRLEIPYGKLRENVYPKLRNLAWKNEKYGTASIPLKELVDDPALFAAYPELADTQVIAQANIDSDSSNGSALGSRIYIYPEKHKTRDQILNTLYHEIQHVIQFREGFENGESYNRDWSRYANAIGEAEARVAGMNAVDGATGGYVPIFEMPVDLTQGFIQDKNGAWREQTYDDLTFQAQRDRAIEDLLRVMNRIERVRSMKGLLRVTKEVLDVEDITWEDKGANGFVATVYYEDGTFTANTYASEKEAISKLKYTLSWRYEELHRGARSSIVGILTERTQRSIDTLMLRAVEAQEEKNPEKAPFVTRDGNIAIPRYDLFFIPDHPRVAYNLYYLLIDRVYPFDIEAGARILGLDVPLAYEALATQLQHVRDRMLEGVVFGDRPLGAIKGGKRYVSDKRFNADMSTAEFAAHIADIERWRNRLLGMAEAYDSGVHQIDTVNAKLPGIHLDQADRDSHWQEVVASTAFGKQRLATERQQRLTETEREALGNDEYKLPLEAVSTLATLEPVVRDQYDIDIETQKGPYGEGWARLTLPDGTHQSFKSNSRNGEQEVVEQIKAFLRERATVEGNTLDRIYNAKTLEELTKNAKTRLNILDAEFYQKTEGNKLFSVYVEYGNGDTFISAYANEADALRNLKRVFANRLARIEQYGNPSSGPRSSISGWLRDRRKARRLARETREDEAMHAKAYAEGDRETAAALVERQAMRSRYIYEAWRGTNDFGGTNLGMRGDVPNHAIFFASSPEMAGTYADDPTVREVGTGDQSGSGVYHVALRFDNPLVVNAQGGTWDTIPYGDWGGVVSTDYLAHEARMKGNDGVIIRNIQDYNIHISHGEERRPGTVYIVLNPEHAKSLDPFTFDNDGNLIPLGQRFDTSTPDIRSSIAVRETLRLPRETEAEARDPRAEIGGIERGARASSLYFGRQPSYRDLNSKVLTEAALFATGKKQTGKSVQEAYQSFGVNVTPEAAAVIADRINDDLKEQAEARRLRDKGEQPRDRTFGLVDALAKAYDANWAEAQKEAFEKGVAGTFSAARQMAEEAQTLAEAQRQEAEAVTGTAPAILETEMGFDIESTLLAAPELTKTKAQLDESVKKAEEQRQEELEQAKDADALADSGVEQPIEAMGFTESKLDELRKKRRELRERLRKLEQEREAQRKETKKKYKGKEGAGEENGSEDDKNYLEYCEKMRKALNGIAFDLDNAPSVREFVNLIILHVAERRAGKEIKELSDLRMALRDPLVVRDAARTLAQIAEDLANRLVPSAARELIVKKAMNLAAAETIGQVRALATGALLSIRNVRIRQGRTELRDAMVKMIDSVVPRGRFAVGKEDSDRSIGGDVARMLDNIRKALLFGEATLEEMRWKAIDLISGLSGRVRKGEAIEDFRDYQTAMRIIASIDRFGHWRRMSLGELDDLRVELERMINGGIEAHELKMRQMEAKIDGFLQPLLAALNQSPPDFKPDQNAPLRERIANALDSGLGLQSLLFEALLARSTGETRAKAQRAVRDLLNAFSEASAKYEATLLTWRERIQQIAERHYGSTGAFMRRMHETVPEHLRDLITHRRTDASEKAGKAAHQRTRITYGQALQIYATLAQRDYAENARIHHRDGASFAAVRACLTDADIAFVAECSAFMRAIFPELRDAYAEVTGVTVGTTPDYWPVKIDYRRDGLSAEVRAWTPIVAAMEPRRKNGLDLKEEISAEQMLFGRLDEWARMLAYGRLGIIAAAVFGNGSFKEAIANSLGQKMEARIQENVKTALMGPPTKADNAIILSTRWASAFAMSGNLGVAFKQFAGIPAFALKIGAKDTLDAWWNGVTRLADADWDADWAILTASNAYKARYGGAGLNAEMRAALQGATPGAVAGATAKAYDIGFRLQSVADRAVAKPFAIGAFRKYREAYLREGLTAEEAQRRAVIDAWALVEDTQQSARPENQLDMVNKSRIIRMLTQFRSAPLQQLQWEMRAWAAFLRGEEGAKEKLARVIFINHILTPLFWTAFDVLWQGALGLFGPGDEDDEEKMEGRRERRLDQWIGELALGAILGQLTAVPVLGGAIEATYSTIAQNIRRKAEGKEPRAMTTTELATAATDMPAIRSAADIAATVYNVGLAATEVELRDVASEADDFLKTAVPAYRDANKAAEQWGLGDLDNLWEEEE